MDENPVADKTQKKKRKYQRRGTHKLVLDGKSYVGSDIKRDGKFLILKTAKGSVWANTELCKTVELVGEVSSSFPSSIPVTAGSPVWSGGAVLMRDKNRELEGMMAMPRMAEES